MTEQDAKRAAQERIEAAADQLAGLSHRVHGHPELAFAEERASAWCAELLRAHGFDVQDGAYGLPTAMRASVGTGPFRVAFCAEYDALPGLGHACGHNIICAASVGAAIGAAAAIDALGLTVIVLGTPGEELFGLRDLPPGVVGAGKALLLEAGAFDGVHAAMMVHPAPVDLAAAASRAVTRVQARFHVSDAGNTGFLASPRTFLAADQAGTLCDLAVGMMQARAPAGLSVHRVLSTGCWGQTAEALVDFAVRGDALDDVEDTASKLADCARSAAAQTGCQVTVEQFLPYAQMRHDPELAALYQANAQARGRNFPDLGPIADQIGYATDMGTISHRLPAIHPFIGIETTALNHLPEFAVACTTPSADQAVIDGAIALAWTALDAAARPEVRHRLLTGNPAGQQRHTRQGESRTAPRDRHEHKSGLDQEPRG